MQIEKKRPSHLDEQGQARMVDIGDKNITERRATASGKLVVPLEMMQNLSQQGFATKKGSIIQTAVIAGTMAVKRTADMIPLCHPLQLNSIHFDIQPFSDYFLIKCSVSCHARTGVEMEALQGVSTAALTLYDMCKALGQNMRISELQVISKSGGKHDFDRTS